MAQPLTIPVALSNRHVHLSREHVEALFGKDHALCAQKPLSQPGQFACQETVELVGPKGAMPGVRVLGPERPSSQVELSITDGFVLGLSVPVRVSGDIAGTPGGHLMGPKGAVRLSEGFIVAARHIHLEPGHAAQAGLVDGQKVAVRVLGRRGLVYEEVVVRVSDKFRTELHLDIDEGNAGAVKNGDLVEVVTGVCELCPAQACDLRQDVSQGVARPFCDFASSSLRIR
jgi:putative phosphotransacetylase